MSTDSGASRENVKPLFAYLSDGESVFSALPQQLLLPLPVFALGGYSAQQCRRGKLSHALGKRRKPHVFVIRCQLICNIAPQLTRRGNIRAAALILPHYQSAAVPHRSAERRVAAECAYKLA